MHSLLAPPNLLWHCNFAISVLRISFIVSKLSFSYSGLYDYEGDQSSINMFGKKREHFAVFRPGVKFAGRIGNKI